MSSAVDKIIFECVDTALSQLGFINKSAFYRLLEESYGINPQEIGSNYETFHIAVVNQFGAKHFIIERIALQIMKKRTKNGIYPPTDEISAFQIITDTIIEDTREKIRRRRYESLQDYADSLKKKVEEQDKKLEDAARMVAIGETAAMVGHDIRNPLQSLISDLYIASEELKEMPDGEHKMAIQESFQAMQENISYINKIIADLQDYARHLTPCYDNVNLTNLSSEIIRQITFPNNIAVEVNIKADLWLKTDPAFIRRVLNNLVNNAIQAMPDGGKLTLSGSKSESTVRLMVSDNGNGIPDEVKERMFTPLVTTKSKGQGLGLAVVKRLVDALHGTIHFESEKGKGTKFTIELPTNQ